MENDSLWKKILAEIELSVSKATYSAQFSKSRLLSFQNNVAVVGLPNSVIRQLVEARYTALIKSILDAHTNSQTSVVFSVYQDRAQEPPLKDSLFDRSFQQTAPPSIEETARRLHIRPDFTFDTYAVSTTNQLAHAAATAVAKSPGKAYNPLFLYGGVGVGKTHLMHAIANQILTKHHSYKIISAMGEEFLNEIVEAIKYKTADKFKQKYRSARLLMIDDIQFIAGKQTVQEEFFHTFNAVQREGGQIVLTSDRPPSEIARLEERLRSRFEGGLLVDVGKPDFELRAAIVGIKSSAKGISIPSDAAQIIAANITDTRAIEGFIHKLSTVLFTSPEPITPELVSRLLGKQNREKKDMSSKRITPQDVISAVSTQFNIKQTAIKGEKRLQTLVRPRQIVMYLLKNELGISFVEIGNLLGGRDHTTIMHGVETITKIISSEEKYREEIDKIKQRLLL